MESRRKSPSRLAFPGSADETPGRQSTPISLGLRFPCPNPSPRRRSAEKRVEQQFACAQTAKESNPPPATPAPPTYPQSRDSCSTSSLRLSRPAPPERDSERCIAAVPSGGYPSERGPTETGSPADDPGAHVA